MRTTNWSSRKSITIFTSKETSPNLDLDLSYNENPPVFLVETFRGKFFMTLDWDSEIKTYEGSGNIRCTVCNDVNPPKHRIVRKSMTPTTADPEDIELTTQYVGSTRLVVCNTCAEEINSLAEDLAEQNSESVVSDVI